ncbi:FUSC family protein [Subsaximicrobium wynnwilliamsii]|jgi:membrane protein implicated in regulation of membrane protease activity|uniref:FUSC family protein n=1 Tax=Subsaximicrobium wynnwilliamsii TaxID=291179 RepID=A0A5C6ZKD4_9FLAO|nr:CD20-like domain-containing protein [Subsaximicrobium wynnwilliamsii]TXD84785.1 FUSC family protein [Subsaximicrobium wynnwilliamsii]TXD90456.1 FUSC family protein [Subsaximicrobium wynnwilliamsii]TXE04932.1 FUSC family protein [Subsaximicrobium wynnwilliamsii]
MRHALLILGFIAAVLAVVLAVTPLSQMSFIPAVVALIAGIFAFYMDKDRSKKAVQLIFILTILSISLATYKGVFSSAEVGNTEELKQKEQQLENESIDELEDLDTEGLEIE